MALTTVPQNIDNGTSVDTDMDIFECGICTEDLNTPKSLPCLHNFCLNCLLKYVDTNGIKPGSTFPCPVCRNETTVPAEGPEKFPTNFHIEKLRKRQSLNLDLGYSLRETMSYWESREDEVVEELNERKRQQMIEVSARREALLTMVHSYVEDLHDLLEDKYIEDSCRAVEVIQSAKNRLVEAQGMLIDETTDTDIWDRVKRQGSTLACVAREIEEGKWSTDLELRRIMSKELVFQPGDISRHRLRYHFGRLQRRQRRIPGDSLLSYLLHQGQVSVLRLLTWSQSWWVLILAIIPALCAALLLRMFLNALRI